MVGHVDHGKTSLTAALSGVWTDTHSEELKKGITIRLGYADTIIRKCPKCDEPQCYTTEPKCSACGEDAEPVKKVSFVDSPGHETLMATMLSGAAIMDGAMLVVAANEPCPQPQTKEHLRGLEILKVKDLIVVQNKIDLVDLDQAKKNYQEIVDFLSTSSLEDPLIVPVSAQQKANIDVLIKAMDERFKPPEKAPDKTPLLMIARSFDVNRPGIDLDQLVGGVIGGTVSQGTFKKGDEIEIRPGQRREEGGKNVWTPAKTTVTTIMRGSSTVDEAGSGGLIGLGTTLDPSLTKSDAFVGHVVGHTEGLPEVWDELMLEVDLLDKVVGTEEELDVAPIRTNELLMFNVGTARTAGVVKELSGTGVKMSLHLPICTSVGSRAAISRRIGYRWRLIGYGTVQG
jgi:translation initiation factor 2 subunit 3